MLPWMLRASKLLGSCGQSSLSDQWGPPRPSPACLTVGHLVSAEWFPPCPVAAGSALQQHTHHKVLCGIFIRSHFWKADHLGMLIPSTERSNPGAVPCQSPSNSLDTPSIVSVSGELSYNPFSTVSHVEVVSDVFAQAPLSVNYF